MNSFYVFNRIETVSDWIQWNNERRGREREGMEINKFSIKWDRCETDAISYLTEKKTAQLSYLCITNFNKYCSILIFIYDFSTSIRTLSYVFLFFDDDNYDK